MLVNQAAASTAGDIVYEAAYLIPWKDHLVPRLAELGVSATCLGNGRDWDPRWVTRLRERLARGDVDVVHVHSPLPAGGARVANQTIPRSRRAALVYTEHNRWPRYSTASRLFNRITYGLDDAHIAVSDDVKASVSPRHRDSVEVLVHGIDVAGVAAGATMRGAVRNELGVADSTVLVGTVANLTPKKGYPDLLAAAEVIDTTVDVQFVSVGQGPLESDLRTRLAASTLGNRFRFLGYRSDAARVMSAFDIFALASHHEGLPVAVMEAQALGLPAVVTAAGGLPEAVEDGVTGRVVPVADPRALGAALSALADDPAARERMGRAAHTAAERYDARRPTDRLEEIYRVVARTSG